MSRNTHTYMSSLLSSFHLVNSCSVCPSDDMDKLNKATIYWKMYIITFCKIYDLVLIKSRSTKCQSTTQKLFFKICNRFRYCSCFVMLIVEVHLAETSLTFFKKNATRLNFVVWKNENILYQFVLVFQLLVVTAHTEPVRFARSKTGTLQQNFINVDKYVKGVK